MVSAAEPSRRGVLDFGRVLGSAAELIRTHGPILLLGSLLVVGLGQAVSAFAVDRLAAALQPQNPVFTSLTRMGLIEGQAFLVAILQAFIAAWATALMVAQATGSASVRPARVADILARSWPIAACALLFQLGVLGATILLIFPALMLAMAWAVSLQALVAEGLTPGKAFSRSLVLTRGHRWPILGMYAVATIIFGAANLLLIALAGGGRALTAAVKTPMARYLVSPLFTSVEHVVIAAVAAGLYVELAILKDGLLRSATADVFG